MQPAVRFVAGCQAFLLQFVLFHKLPALEQQHIYDVGEHVVICFQSLFCNVLFCHGFILSHSLLPA